MTENSALDSMPAQTPPRTAGQGASTAPAQPGQPAPLPVAEAGALVTRILDEVCKAVIGKRDVIRLIMAGLIADGHILLDDVPGVAKTLTARSLATATGMGFSRVQFTPDVLPADVTGCPVLDLATNQPEFRAGPVFANLLLADEINRAPAKTQSALLEAMQERQVTADGVTHPLPHPFLVIATQNPIESEGTYTLPEAQLDRFILRTTMGYPTESDEVALLARRIARRSDEVTLDRVCDVPTFLALQATAETIHVDERLLEYCVSLVRSTRVEPSIAVGSSPRGTLALVKLARAAALLDGRDFVGPDDIRAMAVPALSHRTILNDEAWARQINSDDVVREAIDRVPVPVVG